MVMLA